MTLLCYCLVSDDSKTAKDVTIATVKEHKEKNYLRKLFSENWCSKMATYKIIFVKDKVVKRPLINGDVYDVFTFSVIFLT